MANYEHHEKKSFELKRSTKKANNLKADLKKARLDLGTQDASDEATAKVQNEVTTEQKAKSYGFVGFGQALDICQWLSVQANL